MMMMTTAQEEDLGRPVLTGNRWRSGTRHTWQVWEPMSITTARCSERSQNRKSEIEVFALDPGRYPSAREQRDRVRYPIDASGRREIHGD